MQLDSFSSPLPKAQEWGNEFEHAMEHNMTPPPRDDTMITNIFAVTFHITRKGHENDEFEKEAEGSAQVSTTNSLQHSLKFKSLFDLFEYRPHARLAATEALMRISGHLGPQCYAKEANGMRAFLEITHIITFEDEDMEVLYPDHKKALYLKAQINGVFIRKALVDTRSSVNIVPLDM